MLLIENALLWYLESIVFRSQMEEQYDSTDVLIVAACRTPIGRFCGGFGSLAAHELGGRVIEACLARSVTQFKSEMTQENLGNQLREIVLGQVYSAGCGQNPARRAAAAGGKHFV